MVYEQLLETKYMNKLKLYIAIAITSSFSFPVFAQTETSAETNKRINHKWEVFQDVNLGDIISDGWGAYYK